MKINYRQIKSFLETSIVNELWLKPKSIFFINPRLKSGVRDKIQQSGFSQD
jgi:hypothetical protein